MAHLKLALSCALVMGASNQAGAHGGVYIGPGSTAGPGGATGGGPSSTSAGVPSSDVAAWDIWWSLNRQAYLDAQVLRQRGLPSTRGGGERTAAQSDEPSASPIDPTWVRTSIVPALKTALAQTKDVDLSSATLLALAKIGGLGDSGLELELRTLFEGYLTHANQEIRESAALALGILASATAAPLLAGLLLDAREARAQVGERAVDVRLRAYAAYGLGLIGAASAAPMVRQFSVHTLVRLLESKDVSEEIAVASVMALALQPMPATPPDAHGVDSPSRSRAGQVEFLLARFAARTTTAAELAQLPVAVARLAQGLDERLEARVISTFAKALAPAAKPSSALAQGLIQALSLLGTDSPKPADLELRAALRLAMERGDRSSRHHALLALGRVVGRQSGTAAPGVHAEVQEILLDALSRGNSAERGWAALGLALLEQPGVERGEPAPPAVLAALRHGLSSNAGPVDAGAYCLSLALLGDRTSIPVFEEFTLNGDDNLRGYAATALGLIGAEESVANLRQVVVEKTRYRPGLLREACIALSLLGDRAVVPHLLERLHGASTMIEAVSVASALGHVGDGRALEGLLALVLDEKQSDTTRAFAVVALGQICDQRSRPWNAALARDSSWLNAPSTLFDPNFGKGVLDLL